MGSPRAASLLSEPASHGTRVLDRPSNSFHSTVLSLIDSCFTGLFSVFSSAHFRVRSIQPWSFAFALCTAAAACGCCERPCCWLVRSWLSALVPVQCQTG